MQTKSIHTQLSGAESQGSAMERADFTPVYVNNCNLTISALRRNDILWHVPIPDEGFGACFLLFITKLIINQFKNFKFMRKFIFK